MRRAAIVLLALVAACNGGDKSGGEVRPTPATPDDLGLGRAATDSEIALLDIDVNAAGAGLPAGSGTHAQGALVFAAKCASCHGPKGEGMTSGAISYPKLIGRDPRDGFPFGKDLKYVKTVGNYWPYATTIFDYVRRAMPLDKPGSLTNDEVYAVTAFLLAENEIVAKEFVVNAKSLPGVRMPARDRFVRDDRAPGATFR